MKKRKNLFYIYYFIGICSIAFFITCGGALNYSLHTSSPSFIYIYLITVVELYLIATYYSWLLSYLKAFGTEFARDKSFNRRFMICLMSLMPAIGLHIILIKLYLTSQSSASLASTGYFKNDFLFFIIPLFLYSLYILNYPKQRLFKFRHLTDLKEDYLLLHQINTTMQERIDKLQAKNHSIPHHTDNLLLIWKTAAHLPSLRRYIQDNVPLENQSGLSLHQIVLIKRQTSLSFMILTNGSKWQIDNHLYDEIMSNPWMVSNKKGIGTNMLYTEPTLLQRSHRPDRRWLRLDEELWNVLTQYRSPHKLGNKLESSRRYRHKFLGFWESSNLLSIDIYRQYDRYDWTLDS